MAFTDPNKALLARSILTATSGKRIYVNGPDAPNGIAFYTGDAAETFPGVIQPDTGSDSLDTTYSSPLTAGHAGSQLVLSTGKTAIDQDEIALNSQNVTVAADENIELHGRSYGAGGSYAYGLLTHDGTGPYIDFNAPRIFLRDTDSGNDNGLVVTGNKISSIKDDVWWNAASAGGTVNSWTDTAGSRFAYSKDATGRVSLRGLMKSGTATTIITLPVGYRPTSNLEFTMRAGTVLSSVAVSTAGVLTVTANFTTAASSGIYLDCISFPTI